MEQTKPPAGGGDGDTSVTKVSDGCSVGFSLNSTASSSCSVNRGIHGHASSSNEVRRKYLRRLGIPADIGEAGHPGRSVAHEGSNLASSAPERESLLKPSSSHSIGSSSSRGGRSASTLPARPGGKRHEKIILLRRSKIFTTKLKADPLDERLHGSVAKPSRDRSKEVGHVPTSSGTKFELSSAWTTLLSKDTASTSTASSEPLDGAYDLFSLPSDSSFAVSRDDSARSFNTLSLDRFPSRDDLSLSSVSNPRRRKVSFDSTVKAATIPSRLSYSNRTRTRLWSSTEDIYANAVRNEREYTYDGSDWRTVREESEFLRCSSGSSASLQEDLVHPVHLCGWPPVRPAVQSVRPNQPSPTPPTRSGEDKSADDDDYSKGMFEME